MKIQIRIQEIRRLRAMVEKAGSLSQNTRASDMLPVSNMYLIATAGSWFVSAVRDCITQLTAAQAGRNYQRIGICIRSDSKMAIQRSPQGGIRSSGSVSGNKNRFDCLSWFLLAFIPVLPQQFPVKIFFCFFEFNNLYRRKH